MNKDEIRKAIGKVYEATPDTMWPREAFELALAAYGLNLEDHQAILMEVVGIPEDRDWWAEQVADLRKMVEGDLEGFPWFELNQ